MSSEEVERPARGLRQVCLAYRNDGGRVCVVLSPVEKLEMEARLAELIPPASRFGTTFVVRQGLPLVPDDLRMVAAGSAASTVVISNSSRRTPFCLPDSIFQEGLPLVPKSLQSIQQVPWPQVTA